MSAPPAPTTTRLRNARVAVGACFFINAVFYANVVPRLPEVKADLGLSNSSLGAALAAMPLGALLAALSSAALMRRFGSARVATVGLVLLGLTAWTVSAGPRTGRRWPRRSSSPARSTRSSTWRRTPTGCGCSASTGARS